MANLILDSVPEVRGWAKFKLICIVQNMITLEWWDYWMLSSWDYKSISQYNEEGLDGNQGF